MTFSHATLLYHISRQVATPIAVPYLVYAKSGSGGENTRSIYSRELNRDSHVAPAIKVNNDSCRCFSFQLFTLFTFLLLPPPLMHR